MNTLIDGKADPSTILDTLRIAQWHLLNDNHVQTGLCEGRGADLMVKHLPCKLEGLNSVLRIHKHAGSSAVHLWSQCQGSGDSVTSQPNLIGGFQGSESPCYKRGGCFPRMARKFVLWPAHAHIPACAYTLRCTLTHMLKSDAKTEPRNNALEETFTLSGLRNHHGAEGGGVESQQTDVSYEPDHG